MNDTAANTFIQLKLFPRSKNGAVDNGLNRKGMPDYLCKCGGIMMETVSLEFCGDCGYIAFDYWGLDRVKHN